MAHQEERSVEAPNPSAAMAFRSTGADKRKRRVRWCSWRAPKGEGAGEKRGSGGDGWHPF
jgi:hypothetical protein